MNKFASTRINQIKQLQALEDIVVGLQRKYASELVAFNKGMNKTAEEIGTDKISVKTNLFEKLLSLLAGNVTLGALGGRLGRGLGGLTGSTTGTAIGSLTGVGLGTGLGYNVFNKATKGEKLIDLIRADKDSKYLV